VRMHCPHRLPVAHHTVPSSAVQGWVASKPDDSNSFHGSVPDRANTNEPCSTSSRVAASDRARRTRAAVTASVASRDGRTTTSAR
jgi:hypothetical protein